MILYGNGVSVFQYRQKMGTFITVLRRLRLPSVWYLAIRKISPVLFSALGIGIVAQEQPTAATRSNPEACDLVRKMRVIEASNIEPHKLHVRCRFNWQLGLTQVWVFPPKGRCRTAG
jgi:hypothetical protein